MREIFFGLMAYFFEKKIRIFFREACGWKVRQVPSVFTIHNPKKYPQALMFSLSIIFTIVKVINFINLKYGMTKS